MADDPRTDLHETAQETGAGTGTPLPVPPETVNELAELVADVLEPSGLVALDRLATLRGKVGRGSLAEALRTEGLASEVGVARALAERYHLPFVDISAEEPSPNAVDKLPLAVLQREPGAEEVSAEPAQRVDQIRFLRAALLSPFLGSPAGREPALISQ